MYKVLQTCLLVLFCTACATVAPVEVDLPIGKVGKGSVFDKKEYGLYRVFIVNKSNNYQRVKIIKDDGSKQVCFYSNTYIPPEKFSYKINTQNTFKGSQIIWAYHPPHVREAFLTIGNYLMIIDTEETKTSKEIPFVLTNEMMSCFDGSLTLEVCN